MAAHWQNLLAAMVAEPARTIASLTVLTSEERDRLLVELNTTSMAYPVDCCFHQLFEEQVSRTPSRIAAVFEGSQLTYQELNARANQLASYLRSLHAGSDVLVGIYMERSLEMLIALLGILKAGGAYLPLDPSYPAERLAFMLEDAGVAVLVTHHALVAQLPSHHARVVRVDADRDQFVNLSQANLTTSVTSAHLAYVIYTSGSTGRPKGVQISHRALLNLLLSMRAEPGISAQDTLLAVTTLSFDIAGLELYLPLIVGARLVIASRDVATNGRALAKALAEAHATIMQATPVTWRMLLTSGWLPDPSLKMLCGGEALPLELARQLLLNGSSLYNMYGPTETTIWSTLRKIELTDTTISIGRPIANTTIYILDKHLQPVPMGVPGDLYIGGDGLAHGYLNRPELTAERFVRHPFSANPADRIYRTGDVARYQSDGTIELLGRADQQIKLRGFRIELGEIESVLGQHPAVEQAAALVREDHPGDTYLAAYLVLRSGLHATVAELRQHLSKHVPDYMLPSAFMLLDRLPQTPNGKLDRRALPVPDHVSLDRQDFIAPRTSLEEVIASIWSQVLGIERIGIHDNFFALGGHSLLAMQVASQFHTAFQVDLPLRKFFDAPTVAQIAAVIMQQQTNPIKKQLPALHALTRQSCPDRTLVFPTTSAQQSLWFIDQLDSGNTAYNLPVTLHLYKPLHMEALKQSLAVLVRRHEALRTTFTVIDEQPMQVVAERLDIPVVVKNPQHVSASEQSSMVLQLATQELQRPFDLARGPLLRATVFHLNAEEHILLLVMHHIIADGWSISLLLQEFATLYEAFLLGEPVALPDLPLQFGDFAVWQREWRQSELINEHLSYWKQQLAGAPTTLTLPTDHPRPAQATYHGAMHTFALSAELRAQLKALSQRENVTLYMTLVAAFLVLLQRYSHQDDLLLGTTTAGRTFAETQPVFGYFINTLVLRTDLSGNPTIHELLERVREVTLAADAHQHLPFDMLVRELQLERSPGQSPLFQVFLTLDPPLPELAPGYDSRQLDLATGASKFDLSLELADGPTGIIGHLEYSSDLFDAPTIARMAGRWKILLHAMADDTTRRIAELPLLTDAERQQILFEWNATQIPYCRADTLPQHFEAQVERTPDAVAIMFDNTALTYESLNAQANQVARNLRQRGMQVGTRVAICYERSQELIIALLGILKIGGIYVPLDPAYPVERLAFMLADSRAAALITQQHLLEHLFCALSGDTVSMPKDDSGRAMAATDQSSCCNNMICLDREWSTIAQESQENLACFIDGESPAYMLYTSGSTGTPKGVLGTHRAALNRFNWMWRTYPFAPDEVCCQKTTLSFVDAAWEIFGPLLQGIKTVIIPEVIVKDPSQFLQVLAAHSVTRVVLVPSLLRALLDVATALDQHLPDLRYWICSGEALPLALVQRFQQHLPTRLLLNLYGSSEVAADATCYEVKSATQLVNVPIGRPIDNTQIYLLDRHLQPVPIGVPGELHIGGDGLAQGYFDRPALTATRFIPHPFVETSHDDAGSYGAFEPGAFLYKTGDWARYLPDGNIEYLGRLDHQVKLRGMRVELGEIEAVLKQYPAIREALVLVHEAAPDDQRLVAYIVLHEGQIVADDGLRQHLAQRLPPHMLPSAYIQLDTLPLTPNGKVDRHALPAPNAAQRATTATYVGPQLAIHHQLIQIWEELLNVQHVSIRDNFFTLGGHSLLAARLMARIERIWGKRLPLSILFAGATIEHLATALRNETRSGNNRAPIVAVNAGGTKRPFFFLHGDWQGQGLYCLQLSQALGEERPFYVLETYRYDHLNVLPAFEEVAAAHLAAIQSIQPAGPYTLGGWCNGALFAYEIAQQLHAAGQKVDTLVLMDPGSASPSGRFLSKVIRRVSHSGHLEQKQQVDWFLRFLHIYEYVRLWKERRKHIAIQRRTESEGTPAEVEVAHPNFQSLLPPIENLRQNYLSIFNWWAASYKITPYAGRIAVFWTKEDDARRRKDWERILAGRHNVDIYTVPGTHVTSRTRYAQDLAKSLRDCLDK
ncbi:MAG TPA: amino acid adenylation domain-containing protein [Ktedonobacteraceae bacterium]|nr:amino acid adenylation domain-containing protein [Ktedonobacteraceae bacterium]